jgi:TonB-dependent starch-binding outer membrane protein SusC
MGNGLAGRDFPDRRYTELSAFCFRKYRCVVNYYVSGAYFDQKGVIIGSEYNRFSVTSNLDVQASKKLKQDLTCLPSVLQAMAPGPRKAQAAPAGSGVIASAFKFEPDQNIYDANGNFTVARLNDPHDNPYAIATQNISNESLNDRIQGNLLCGV